MEVYLRRTHRTDQNPEKDTVGPFKFFVGFEDTRKVLAWLNEHGEATSPLSRSMHRAAKGGFVVMLRKPWTSVAIMPTGSELHIELAPPSHFYSDGPLHDKKPS